MDNNIMAMRMRPDEEKMAAQLAQQRKWKERSEVLPQLMNVYAAKAEVEASGGGTVQLDQHAEKLRKRIVKEEPEDENKYSQLLIKDDGLDNPAASEAVNPDEFWDPMYDDDVPRRQASVKTETKDDLQKAEDAFAAAYPDIEVLEQTAKPKQKPEDIIVVPDDDEVDEYEPRAPSDVPVQTYSLPGLDVSAELALRPSANPTLETLGLPNNEHILNMFPGEVAKLSTAIQEAQTLPANPYEPPKPTADAAQQQSEGMFVAQDFGFSGAQSVPMRKLQFNGQRAPTVCFEGRLLSSPYQHMLNCGHAVETLEIVPCGFNCKQSTTFDSKPFGTTIACTDEKCLKEAKQRSAMFMPKRIVHRGATPVDPIHSIPSHVYGMNRDADRRYEVQQGIETAKLLGGLDFSGSNTTPGRRRATLAQQKQRARKRSASPPNVQTRATYRDRDQLKRQEPVDEAEVLLSQRLKAAKGDDPPLVPAFGSSLTGREKANLEMNFKEGMYAAPAKPRRVLQVRDQPGDVAMQQATHSRESKELQGLKIAGTARLGFQHATQAARQTRAQIVSAGFQVHNHKEMVRPDRRPNAFATGGVRNEVYQNLGMTEGQYAKMKRDEEHIVIEQEDRGDNKDLTRDGRFDRENFEDDMADEDRPNNGDFEIPETRCVCDSPADSSMIPCKTCRKHFHPSCVDKGQFARSSGVYEGESRMNNLFSDVDLFSEGKEVFTCQGCDAKSEFASKMLRPVKQGGLTESGGVIKNLRKRGAERVKADERELARTSQGQLRHEALFGKKEDLDDATDDFHPEIDRVKRRKTARFAPAVQAKHSIKSKTTSTQAEMETAFTMSDVGMTEYLCGLCDKRIFGAYYNCKDCSMPWGACPECVKKGSCHRDVRHEFEIRHPSGVVKVSMEPLEAGAVADEAEALEAQEDDANDAALSSRLGGTVLQRPAPVDNMFTRAKLQPASAKSTAPRKVKPQSRGKSRAPSKRAVPKASPLTPNQGDVEMGEAHEVQSQLSAERRRSVSQASPPTPTRQLRARGSAASKKATVENDSDAMVE
ncbi:hypothetical protein LTR85_000276 [Meristemomyces frigidus]|nr:hypothetical protein LTR85_000276 [Meristemomyces frigidus]